MEDRLVGHFGLAVDLRVRHSSEPSLAAQAAEIVREPTGIELPAVIKDNGTGNAVSPNEPSYLSVVTEATALASITW